jgi:hypothetical protein
MASVTVANCAIWAGILAGFLFLARSLDDFWSVSTLATFSKPNRWRLRKPWKYLENTHLNNHGFRSSNSLESEDQGGFHEA